MGYRIPFLLAITLLFSGCVVSTADKPTDTGAPQGAPTGTPAPEAPILPPLEPLPSNPPQPTPPPSTPPAPTPPAPTPAPAPPPTNTNPRPPGNANTPAPSPAVPPLAPLPTTRARETPGVVTIQIKTTGGWDDDFGRATHDFTAKVQGKLTTSMSTGNIPPVGIFPISNGTFTWSLKSVRPAACYIYFQEGSGAEPISGNSFSQTLFFVEGRTFSSTIQKNVKVRTWEEKRPGSETLDGCESYNPAPETIEGYGINASIEGPTPNSRLVKGTKQFADTSFWQGGITTTQTWDIQLPSFVGTTLPNQNSGSAQDPWAGLDLNPLPPLAPLPSS